MYARTVFVEPVSLEGRGRKKWATRTQTTVAMKGPVVAVVAQSSAVIGDTHTAGEETL